MTKRETIDAFIRGDIDRRTFIGRLTTLGVSSGAALAYATTFGQSALAAPSSGSSGFAMQGQDDSDYGVPNPFPLDEAIEIITGIFEELLAIFEGLADFVTDDFAEGIFDVLTTIQEQLETQLEALNSLFDTGAVGTTRQFGQRSRLAAVQAGDPDALLQSLASKFDELTAAFAAVVPGTDDDVARQTMMNIAMVSGRQAGVVNWAAGNDPFPSAFEEPVAGDL